MLELSYKVMPSKFAELHAEIYYLVQLVLDAATRMDSCPYTGKEIAEIRDYLNH